MPFYRAKKGQNKYKKYYGKKKVGAAKGKKENFFNKFGGGSGTKRYYKKRPTIPNYSRAARSVVEGNTQAANILKTRIKMKYVQQCNVSIQVGKTHTTQNSHQMRAASIYDPDLAASGDSAAGWAIMNTYYRKYMVTAAKIEVQFTMNGLVAGHGNIGSMFAVYLKLREGATGDSPAPSFSALQLNGNAVWKIFPAPVPGSTFSHTLTGWYIPQRFYGPEADPKSADWDRFGSVMAGSPAPDGKTVYWDYGLWNTDDTQVPAVVGLNALVTVTYWPIFIGPIDLTEGLRTEEDVVAYGESLIAKGVQEKHRLLTKSSADADDAELDQLTGALDKHALKSPTVTPMELAGCEGGLPAAKVTLQRKA